MNAKNVILELTNGEEIEAIMLGCIGWLDDKHENTFYPKNMVEEALKVLDFEFDEDFGGENGYRLFAWTKSKVIIKTVYDGSEEYVAIPRNPSDVVPDAYGGG